MSNAKAAAWDVIGDLFWERGRKSAKPSGTELDLFARGVGPGTRACVIGASTKDLAERLLDLGARVTVYDFSQGMCDSLRAALAGREIEIRRLDATAPLDAALIGSQDLVLSDRLVNRFTAAEASLALASMCALAEDGEVRASIKLGLYPMDERMIEVGRARGTLGEFYDEASRTMDFSKAGPVLEEALMAHGEIDRETLLVWYRGRAAETRFDDADIRRIARATRLPDGRPVAVRRVDDFPDAGATSLYSIGAA